MKKSPKKELTPEETKLRAIKELVSTEREYYQDLRLLADYYQKPLMNNSLKLIGSEDEAKKIFSNLSELTVLSKKLTTQFETAAEDSTGTDIAGVFINCFEDIKATYSIFCTSHNIYVTAKHEKLKNNPVFSQWEEEQKQKIPDPRKKLQMSDFLIKPVQRITKYSLMLETIKKNTPVDSPAAQVLSDGITCINSLVLFINERTKEIETENKISQLVSAIENAEVINQLLGKLLIFEMSCKTSNRLATPDIRLALFEHLLLVLKIKKENKLSVIANIEFGNLNLVDLAETFQADSGTQFEARDKSIFLNKNLKEKERDKACFTFFASSPLEKKKLWDAFNQAQKNYYSKKFIQKEDPTTNSPKEVSRLRNQVGSTKILEQESLVAARTLSGKNLKEQYANSSPPPASPTLERSNQTIRNAGPTWDPIDFRRSNTCSPQAASPSPTLSRQSRKINLSRHTLKMEAMHSADDLFLALQWSPKPIKSPILDLPSALQPKSRQAFKNVMIWMGDLPSKNKIVQIKAFQEFIDLGINNAALQDELIVQIIMQMKNNPHRENEIRGWQMFTVALQGFIPQTKEVQKMINDLITAYKEVELTRLIPFCQQINQLQQENPIYRRRGPSEQEIRWLESDAPAIKIHVNFLDGTTKSLHISPIDSAASLRDQIWEKLGGETPKYDWGIFEQSSVAIRAIGDNELLVDYLSLWEDLQAVNKKKVEEPKFLFKRRFWSQDLKKEAALIQSQPVLFNIIHTQLLEQVVNGTLPITLPQSYSFFPYYLYGKYGPRKSVDLEKNKLQNFFPTYLSKAANCKLASWIKTVENEWNQLNLTQDEAKKKCLQLLHNNPFLGCYVVNVTYKSSKKWLVLSKDGILISEPRNPQPTKVFKYHDVINCITTKDSLKLEYGNVNSPSSLVVTGHNIGGADALISLFRTLYL